jgi:hypothetical protein
LPHDGLSPGAFISARAGGATRLFSPVLRIEKRREAIFFRFFCGLKPAAFGKKMEV